MTIQRMDNVLIVVDDLDRVMSFFVELGMELEGRMPVEGRWVESVIGIDDVRQEVSVSLYGEVQKEVVEATLAAEYGLAVTFRETTTLCVERLLGTGAAISATAALMLTLAVANAA
mgnify:CR=1 FL=1